MNGMLLQRESVREREREGDYVQVKSTEMVKGENENYSRFSFHNVDVHGISNKTIEQYDFSNYKKSKRRKKTKIRIIDSVQSNSNIKIKFINVKAISGHNRNME